jgi:predicted solute-binding protein
LHGPWREDFDVSFAVPSECAERLARGDADIGIVPVAELPALGLDIIRGTGIAARGAVRSILLISKVDFRRVKRLAADVGSRTSVALARIILGERYGSFPVIEAMQPDLDGMLNAADAALIIGDPALRLDPNTLPYEVIDLSAEWLAMTGLPMVFAVWAGRREVVARGLEEAFTGSCHFGLERLEEIAATAPARGISVSLARRYLTEHIVFELGERDYQGMELFLQHAAQVATLDDLGTLHA